MSPQHESDNAYVSELKSLVRDKFFMMLLGISVAIVILSTFYSFIRPKGSPTPPQLSDAAVAVTATPSAMAVAVSDSPTPSSAINAMVVNEDPESDTPKELEGLSVDADSDQQEKDDSLFGKLKNMLGLGTSTPQVSDAPVVSPTEEAIVSPTETPPPKADQPLAETVTPARAPVTSSQVKPGQEYTVVAGDNLWNIAQKTYGSGYNFVDIVSSNALMDPDRLLVGTKLKMPQVAVRQPAGEITDTAAMTKSADKVPANYTVQEGDNLWNISVQVYNNGYQWTKLASLNNIPQPDFINPGQVLKLR